MGGSQQPQDQPQDAEQWQGGQGQEQWGAPEWHGWGWNESWYSGKGGKGGMGGLGKGGKGGMGGMGGMGSPGGKGGAASTGDPWAGYQPAEVLRAAANILEGSWGRS